MIRVTVKKSILVLYWYNRIRNYFGRIQRKHKIKRTVPFDSQIMKRLRKERLA